MSCNATSSYLTLFPYYHNESKLNTQDHSLLTLNLIMGIIWKCGNHSSQLCLILPKQMSLSTERYQSDSHETLDFNCLQI